MIPSDIKWHAPRSLEETVGLLNELCDARLIAGGTDLLVDLKEGLLTAKNLVSLQKIKTLQGIEEENGRIHLGALVTPRTIAANPLIRQHIPSLAEAAESMSSTQIRTMATVGGNIASAVPSADLPPSLIAAGASIQLVCCGSARELTLAEFFSGPRQTVCGAGELLTFIYVPELPPHTGCSYQKFTLREANSLAVASAAARITLIDNIIDKAAIVLGAVAPTPFLASETSAFLNSRTPSEDILKKAAEMAMEESRPISDIRGSEWFRKELIPVLAFRALTNALSRAQITSMKDSQL